MKAKNKISVLEKQVAVLKDESLDEDAVANVIAQIVAKIKTLSATLTSNNKPKQDTIIDFKF